MNTVGNIIAPQTFVSHEQPVRWVCVKFLSLFYPEACRLRTAWSHTQSAHRGRATIQSSIKREGGAIAKSKYSVDRSHLSAQQSIKMLAIKENQ